MKKFKIILVRVKVYVTVVQLLDSYFIDKKLADSFQKSMDAGMLRYLQPKGANEIKVSFHSWNFPADEKFLGDKSAQWMYDDCWVQ